MFVNFVLQLQKEFPNTLTHTENKLLKLCALENVKNLQQIEDNLNSLLKWFNFSIIIIFLQLKQLFQTFGKFH